MILLAALLAVVGAVFVMVGVGVGELAWLHAAIAAALASLAALTAGVVRARRPDRPPDPGDPAG